MIYQPWRKFVNPNIDIEPVELAGRGKRINQPMYSSIKEAVEDVYNIIEEHLDQPYAFFGHSMGAGIAYELTHKIVGLKKRWPSAVIFSGRSAPHVERADDKKYHLMDEDLFRKEVIELGGTPPEFFDYPELMDLFIPLLKNDFKLAETDIYNGKIDPLPMDIHVFLGEDDDLTKDQCDGWKQHSERNCNIHYFEGGHFFLNDDPAKIVGLVNEICGQPEIVV